MLQNSIGCLRCVEPSKIPSVKLPLAFVTRAPLSSTTLALDVFVLYAPQNLYCCLKEDSYDIYYTGPCFLVTFSSICAVLYFHLQVSLSSGLGGIRCPLHPAVRTPQAALASRTSCRWSSSRPFDGYARLVRRARRWRARRPRPWRCRTRG
jgi:hypothetical protein